MCKLINISLRHYLLFLRAGLPSDGSYLVLSNPRNSHAFLAKSLSCKKLKFGEDNEKDNEKILKYKY